LPLKITLTVEADEALCARLADLVERIVAGRPQQPPPRPKFEDIPPATAWLSPTPHRFRRSNDHA
jgi:hypothetical protein